ncbi:response regulator transcription factor [Sphingomonas fuzhouensis]|uniref:response regulator transcription factor n=1 Tax=Sphingomonas fuzhouensis TaxID=3106033 RepID=UPI002AFF2B9B|nr:response regulator [Sphingomonas sp. SGZ-02]
MRDRPDDTPLVRIVDDQLSVREAVADLLASVGLAARGYASAAEFQQQDDPARPGCMVLDVRMPGSSGFDLLATMTAQNAALPVIFVTGHGDIAMAVRAMKAGAVDFLAKPFNDQQLIDAVNAAIREDTARRKTRAIAADAARRLSTLSEGEYEVMRLTIEGLRVKQIADRLNISEITVKTRRARMMQKLETTTLIELFRMTLVANGADI